jgi:peptidoglycan DL-endopeptidase CwlO
MAPSPTSRRVRNAVIYGVLVLTFTVWTGVTSPAQADDTTSQQIDSNRQRQADMVARTAALDAQLAAAHRARTLVEAKAAGAAEAFNGAMTQWTQAVREEKAAIAHSRNADAAARLARQRHGEVAATVYRSAGNLGELGAALAAKTPTDLARDAAVFSRLARQRNSIQRDSEAAFRAAEVERQRAAAATAARERARGVAQSARATAEREASTVRGRVASIDRQRKAVLVELATLRRTSVELEQRRIAEAAAATTGGTIADISDKPTAAAATAIAYAKAQLGKPYLWGGTGPDSYDCSGLTMRAWESAGVSLPHFTDAQYAATTQVPLAALAPGDLIFFAVPGDTYATYHHVGLYVGGGMMIEAPYTGAVVRESSIVRDDLATATRVTP